MTKKRDSQYANRAFFDVSYELLAELLMLPEGTQITMVTHRPDNPTLPTFRVYVEHPDFPKTEWGYSIPRVSPTYQAEYIKMEGDEIEVKQVSFVSWGIE